MKRIKTWHEQKARILLFSLAGLLLWMVFGSAIAEQESASSMDTFQMGMGMFGGLALFLFGMEQMGDGLKAAAGERMKDILRSLTRTRVHAALTGAMVTAVIQSSSVTTVLVVGFVSAGLMTVTQSVGIIMGANVGTTITAQIVAFKVEEAALLMIAVGFAMMFLSKRDSLKHSGSILMGLGLVFFGMGIMNDSMSPLRSYQPFLNLMEEMDQPLLAIFVAASFTALVQSSSATTGIVIVMASQGFITLEAGIALALGANVGTCVTALLASLGKPPEAVRAAVVHVLFNVLGVALWLFLIPQLAAVTVELSPIYNSLSGTERLAAETPRQIANANTLFNIINTIVFLGFAGVFASLATKMVKDRPADQRLLVQPKYLEEKLLSTPSLALDRVRMELGEAGKIVETMLRLLPETVESGSSEKLVEIAQLQQQVRLLESSIVEYLGQIQRSTFSESESKTYINLISSIGNIESIGNLIKTDIVSIAQRMKAQNVSVSDTMQIILQDLGDVVARGLALTIEAIKDNNENSATEVIALKAEVDHWIADALAHQASRLKQDAGRRVHVFRLEMELVEALKRIHTLSKRVAKTVIPEKLTARNE